MLPKFPFDLGAFEELQQSTLCSLEDVQDVAMAMVEDVEEADQREPLIQGRDTAPQPRR